MRLKKMRFQPKHHSEYRRFMIFYFPHRVGNRGVFLYRYQISE